MWWVVVAAVILVGAQDECPLAPTTPGDRRTDKQTLKVATYNVEWLFDGVDDAHSPWQTPTDVAAHLASVAGQVNTADADILVLPEVEDCGMLSQLLSKVDSKYATYLKKGSDSYTGQDVGLLTRVDPVKPLVRDSSRAAYPIQNSGCGYTAAETTTSVSKNFYTTFQVGDLKIGVIGIHLVAHPEYPNRCSQREGQALVIAARAKALLAETDGVIILGDFNDFSHTTKDISNNVPISQVMPILVGDHEGGPLPKGSFFQVEDKLAQDQRYSYGYGRYKGLIDHILVSSSLKDRITEVRIDHAVTKLTDKATSDHYPMLVTFALGGMPPSPTPPPPTPVATAAPKTTAPTPPTPSCPTCNPMELKFLDEQREVRSAVSTNVKIMPTMTWDSALAAAAQKHADRCTMRHSSYTLRTGSAGSVFGFSYIGENTLKTKNAKCDAAGAKYVVDKWASESNDWDPKTGNCDRGSWGTCSRYTQIVWSRSTSVGCGCAVCETQQFFVCWYGPGGNLDGIKPYSLSLRDGSSLASEDAAIYRRPSVGIAVLAGVVGAAFVAIIIVVVVAVVLRRHATADAPEPLLDVECDVVETIHDDTISAPSTMYLSGVAAVPVAAL